MVYSPLSSVEEQLNRALGELQLLDQLVSDVRSRIATLQAMIAEHDGAISFIEEMRKESGRLHLLVPIGGGNYVHAEITSLDKVEVSVGAGVVMTKTAEEGKQLMEKRRENLSKAVQAYEERLVQYLRRMEELKRTVEALSARLREKK